MPSSFPHRGFFWVLAFLVLGMEAFGPVCVAGNTDVPTLNSEHCQLCHKTAPLDIAEAGGAHKTQITCLDCHQGHPPLQMEIIPACQLCHTGKPHYALEQCLSCHTNPHRPLETTFPEKITAPCLTCHETESIALQTYPSGHSQLSCTGCHLVHGTPPACTECHRPHDEEMKSSSCTGCHEAHSPTRLEYRQAVSASECGSCHGDIRVRLAESASRHTRLDCLTCHLSRHGSILDCTGCHGTPHSKTIHDQFDRCQECHNEAHNLSI